MKLLFLAAATTTIMKAAAFAAPASSYYDFTVQKNGQDHPLSQYKNKPVVLVVNVASQCGYTDSNYRQLQQMYEKYAESGLDIHAFPCNQFGKQEPGTEKEIQQFAKEKYGVTFPVFSKLEVNGEGADPLYKWLKANTPSDASGAPVRWNFAKWLVVNGKPTERYGHDVAPKDLEKDIVQALRKAAAGEL